MDSRTERILSRDKEKMVSDVQLKELLKWLDDGSGKIKFIVTSVPVFPDLISDAEDKWSAFPSQRKAILEHIRSRKISKVVFVSGDVHCSFTSELCLKDDSDFLVHCIVSSSFFWPYPHMAESDFAFGKVLSGTGKQRYVSKRTSPVYSDDNFARIEANLKEVKVTFYERKGQALGKAVKLQLKA